MSDMLPYLILIVLLGILIPGAIYLIRQEQKGIENLKNIAAKHGWTLRKHPAANRAFLIAGRSQTIDWEIELYRSGRSQTALTQWQTTSAAFAAGPLVIGGKVDRAISNGDDRATAISKVDWELLARPSGWGALAFPSPLGGKLFAADLSNLSIYPAGSSDFQSRYVVFAQSPAEAQKVITLELEEQFIHWPESPAARDFPLVIADPEGIRVQLQNERAISEPDVLERIIDMGIVISNATMNL